MRPLARLIRFVRNKPGVSRFLYNHVFYRRFFVPGARFFNVGILPVDEEILSLSWCRGQESQAQIYLEAVKAWRSMRQGSPGRVLEISCGLGGGLRLLEHCFPQAHLLGLDISYRALLRSRECTGARLLQGDANSLPLANASCDLLVNVESELLHHTHDFYDEIARVLTPTGICVILDIRLSQEDMLRRKHAAYAQHSGLAVLRFDMLTDRVLAAVEHKEAFLRHTARIPSPFRIFARNMAVAPGSRRHREFAEGVRNYFLCVLGHADHPQHAGQ